MIAPTAEVQEAAAKLTGDVRFEVLKLWLVASRKAAADALTTANGEALFRQLQGECQTLDKIIGMIDYAAANR
jgi:hypothetical protein